MRSVLVGKISGFYSLHYKIKNIPALKVRVNDGENFHIDTIWGRQVLGIEKNDASVSIYPDMYGGLPIYCYSYNHVFYFANNFEDLISLIPTQALPEIDKDEVLRYLFMEDGYTNRKILKNVFVANGNNVIKWDGNDFTIQSYYADTINQYSGPSEFHEIVKNKLQWATKFHHGEIGVTLSGGVDSAVIWAGLISLGVKPVALTIIYPGENGKRQYAKVKEIVSATNSKWIVIEKDYPPLDSPNDPYIDRHHLLFNELGKQAFKAGVKILLGGLGGNELALAVHYGEVPAKLSQKTIPAYFTKQAVSSWEKGFKNQISIDKQIPRSAFNATGVTGVYGVEQDLWNEEIFSQNDFWEWSKLQPNSWGTDKNGMNTYLRNSGLECIADSHTTEDFEGIYLNNLRNLMKSGKLDEIMSSSVLATWGWINVRELLKLNESDINELSNKNEYVWRIYVMEQFLQKYIKFR